MTKLPIVLTTLAALMSASVRCSTNQADTASSWEMSPPPSRRSSAISANSARFATTSAAAMVSVQREGG